MPRVSPSYGQAPAPGTARAAQLAAATRQSAQRAMQRANRRRALPRWAERSLRFSWLIVPTVLGTGAALWAWQAGFGPANVTAAIESGRQSMLHVTARSGLAIADVQLIGRKEADGGAILQALGVVRGTPILDFDPHAARHALEQVAWVAGARIERRLPDTIVVEIVERVPMALWQHDQKLFLVDGEGSLLSSSRPEDYPNLPILVGEDAPRRGPELIRALKTEPDIRARVDAAVLISGRRWDLRLDNGIDVRLPETDIAEALHQLAAAESTHKLLEKDIVAIDLRVPDRLTIQTSAAAAERRRPTVAQKRV